MPNIIKRKTNAPAAKAKAGEVRINKYLAAKGYSTRRGADELIIKGKVFINGMPAELGSKVLESDVVEVRQRAKTLAKYTYIVFNKPVGMLTNHDSGVAAKNTRDIMSSLPKDLQALKLFPVGRLDKDSHGLIILTNDGRVTDRLLNPMHEHSKVYEVTVKDTLRNNFKEKIEAGIDIEGYMTKPAKVKILSEKKFLIEITEGKTHQIRRMVAALWNEVVDLKRISVMNISLGKVAPGSYRKVEGKELEEFLKGLGL